MTKPVLIIGRATAATALVFIAVAIVTVWSGGYRNVEAKATGAASSLTMRTEVYQHYWLTFHGRDAAWFDVTRECSSNLIVAPLLVLAAISMLVINRFSAARVIAGLAAGAGTFFVTNIGRLALIGVAYHRWGEGSQWATHDLVGSFITVIAALVALIAQLLVTAGLRPAAISRSFDRGTT